MKSNVNLIYCTFISCLMNDKLGPHYHNLDWSRLSSCQRWWSGYSLNNPAGTFCLSGFNNKTPSLPCVTRPWTVFCCGFIACKKVGRNWGSKPRNLICCKQEALKRPIIRQDMCHMGTQSISELLQGRHQGKCHEASCGWLGLNKAHKCTRMTWLLSSV